MGWNLLITVVENTTPAELREVGMMPVGETISGEEASLSGFDGIAAAQFGPHTVLLNPSCELFGQLSDLEVPRRRDTRIVSAVFGSTSDTYVWSVESAAGSRQLVSAGHEIVDDTGDALPQEEQLADLDEDSLFDLLERTTGFGNDTEWFDQQWQPVTFPEPQR